MDQNQYNSILYRVSEGMAFITLNRPDKLNSLDQEGMQELSSALQKADRDEEVKVIILTGSGERAFCAGFDILNVTESEIQDSRDLHIRNLVLYRTLMDLQTVTIAAVNGLALGAGFEISLLCDLTIAAGSARFSMPELATGVYPGLISVALLWQMVGKKRAAEILMTGRRIPAPEMADMGLVNQVAPDQELAEKALEMARKVMGQGPVALGLLKARLNRILRSHLDEELSHFVEVQTIAFGSKDFKEGLAAIKEKRKPRFGSK